MLEKIIIYLSLILIILLGVFLVWYFSRGGIVFDVLIFNKQPQKKEAELYRYDDERISLNKILVRAFYLVAQDKKDSIIPDWQKVLGVSLGKTCDFYELQFTFNMEMDFEIYPQVIYSKQKAEYFTDLIVQDYQREIVQPHSKSKTLEEVVKEAEEKIKDDGEWEVSLERIDDAYVVNLFVITLGTPVIRVEDGLVLGLDDETNNALVFSEALTDKDFKDFYDSVISHEIGHSLGIPEFYTYSGNEVRSYGVMGSGFSRKLQHNYLEYEIKEKMGLTF